MSKASAPSPRRPKGRPRSEEVRASLDDIFAAALTAFATQSYDRVSLRTLNRQLGGSHNMLSGRFGSKEALWYATVDWAFAPMARRLATAFDPTLSDPLEQLRITIRTFLLHAAEHPELVGVMNIEGAQNTPRLEYIYNTYIAPTLEPVGRVLDHLAAQGRTRPLSVRMFHFMLAHGAAAPFTLAPLSRLLDAANPLDLTTVEAHAELAAAWMIRAIEIDCGTCQPRKDQ
jgi:AcrR family transcriptional regulator